VVYSGPDWELMVLIFNFACFVCHRDGLHHPLWFARARVSFGSSIWREDGDYKVNSLNERHSSDVNICGILKGQLSLSENMGMDCRSSM